jgi:hypothetical protein
VLLLRNHSHLTNHQSRSAVGRAVIYPVGQGGNDNDYRIASSFSIGTRYVRRALDFAGNCLNLAQRLNATVATIPSGAACYFCLGEEADEEGMPLVRNCSCRGDSAGFAHLSCLEKYAEQKCKQAGESAMGAFTLSRGKSVATASSLFRVNY